MMIHQIEGQVYDEDGVCLGKVIIKVRREGRGPIHLATIVPEYPEGRAIKLDKTNTQYLIKDLVEML